MMPTQGLVLQPRALPREERVEVSRLLPDGTANCAGLADHLVRHASSRRLEGRSPGARR